MQTPGSTGGVGRLIRDWRMRRRMTQMELAGAANVSTRHLSFLENGRALPSRAMIVSLAEHLAVPLRERNTLLTAAGYAPMYRERSLTDPALAAAHRAVDQVLRGHEPFPALVIDRHWNMLAHNAAVPPLLDGVDPALLNPPVNVVRLSLHPQGLAPRIVNFSHWRRHLLLRLEQQLIATADAFIAELLQDVRSYAPATGDDTGSGELEPTAVAVPLELRTAAGVLCFISTTTVFGTPVDVTLAEIALETFFPADDATARALGVGRSGH